MGTSGKFSPYNVPLNAAYNALPNVGKICPRFGHCQVHVNCTCVSVGTRGTPPENVFDIDILPSYSRWTKSLTAVLRWHSNHQQQWLPDSHEPSQWSNNHWQPHLCLQRRSGRLQRKFIGLKFLSLLRDEVQTAKLSDKMKERRVKTVLQEPLYLLLYRAWSKAILEFREGQISDKNGRFQAGMALIHLC